MRFLFLAVLLVSACVGPPSAPVSASPTLSPSPSPTPTPLPTATPLFPGGQPNAEGPVRDGFVRYRARLVDERTGEPIVRACVYTGPPIGCPLPGSSRTDASGMFAVDLPAGLVWEFTFEHPKYKPILRTLLTPDTDTVFQLAPTE